MKRLRVLLLPPGWDASPSQGYPQHYFAGTPFIHLDGERQRGAKFLALRNNMTAETRPGITDIQVESPKRQPLHRRASTKLDF